MNPPIVGFAGMTHLGLVSAIAASEKGFEIICFDSDADLIKGLNLGVMPINEPLLDDLAKKNDDRLTFTSNIENLQQCDLIYIAPDIPTNDVGESNLLPIEDLLSRVLSATNKNAIHIILSQVPPGFTRKKNTNGRSLFYQVETLVFGRAIERALFPERYIVGCINPEDRLPIKYEYFLKAHDCPILQMRYESAELAKISINMCLVSSVSVANTMAELCEHIGADWLEIAPALRLDKRIGPYSYLTPGLGISGGNLERDLYTVCQLANEFATDAGVVRAWLDNSQHRKNWPFRSLLSAGFSPKRGLKVAIWGLSYKENTHSTKNSPSLLAISQLQEVQLYVFDPVVVWDDDWHSNVVICKSALDALSHDIDVLMIMTPWPEFKMISGQNIFSRINPDAIVIDPYKLINSSALSKKERARIRILGCNFNFENKELLIGS